MKNKLLLYIVLFIQFFIVVIGVLAESLKQGIYNGSFVHILIGPVLPLLMGSLVLFIRRGFWKIFFWSWMVTSASYLLILIVSVRHYAFEWQPEWVLFWFIQSIVLFVIHRLTIRHELEKR